MTESDLTVAELTELAGLFAPLDPVLTDPTRLRIQAALHALPSDAEISFTLLRKTLQLTGGNLGAHVKVLFDAGFDTTANTGVVSAGPLSIAPPAPAAPPSAPMSRPSTPSSRLLPADQLSQCCSRFRRRIDHRRNQDLSS